jgi:hypothetical protein
MNGSRCQGVDASDFLFLVVVVLQSLSTGPTVTILGATERDELFGNGFIGSCPLCKGITSVSSFLQKQTMVPRIICIGYFENLTGEKQ